MYAKNANLKRKSQRKNLGNEEAKEESHILLKIVATVLAILSILTLIQTISPSSLDTLVSALHTIKSIIPFYPTPKNNDLWMFYECLTTPLPYAKREDSDTWKVNPSWCCLHSVGHCEWIDVLSSLLSSDRTLSNHSYSVQKWGNHIMGHYTQKWHFWYWYKSTSIFQAVRLNL